MRAPWPRRPEVHRDDAGEADSMPTSAKPGKPPTSSPLLLSGPICQPTVAAARSTTINTPLALSVPLTVITPPCHGLTGPSVIGVATSRRDRVRAQPGSWRRLRSSCWSLSIGLAMYASLGERVTRRERYSRLFVSCACDLGETPASVKSCARRRPTGRCRARQSAIRRTTWPSRPSPSLSKCARWAAAESHFWMTR